MTGEGTAAAAATEPRERLRRRAAVLVDFDVAQVARPSDEPDAVLDFLDEDCLRVPVPGGPSRWALTDAVRSQVLASHPRQSLREERESIPEVADTAVQQALDRSLAHGWDADEPAGLDLEGAGSVAVVAKWWAGRNERVPGLEQMSSQVERLRLFADVRAMARDHFVGRADVLARLRQHLLMRERRPLMLWGLGGIGKSAVLARHVVEALDVCGALVVLLDFDDASVNPIYLAELSHGILDGLAAQAPPGLGAQLAAAQQESADEAYYGVHRGASPQRAITTLDVEWARILARGLALVSAPVLIVLDTVEQVQRRGPSAVLSLQALVGQLSLHEHVSVVLSGRARVPQLTVTEYPLRGLEPAQAVELILDISDNAVDPDKAAALVELFGTSPLTVRLVAALLVKTQGEPDDLFDLQAANEQLDAELYLRLLGHITDDPVRRLAHPGLVLRRITPDLIQHVLAVPCRVEVRDEREARDLLTRLAAEPMLVDEPEPGLLVHRQDVRAVMLPQLLRDRKVDVAAVQRAAVAYYAARGDLDSRVEELYHRLLLGEPAQVLDERWDPRASDRLITAVTELPRQSRVYLLRQMSDRVLSPEDRALVGDADWAAEVEPEVLRLHAAGDPAGALRLLQERRTPEGGSLLPALEVETLESLGELAEASQVAKDAMRAASARFDSAEVTTFALHHARLLERTRAAGQARVVLQEALTAIDDPGVDRLRLLIAWLGLTRRHEPQLPERRSRADEAVHLARRLGTRAVAEVPGLLRDVAAEVGEQAPDLLTTALGIVGLDALAGGAVPQRLEELAASTDRAMVSDLMQMPPRRGIRPEPLDFHEVVNQPRGVTGKGLVEVLAAVGDEGAGLRTAVSVDYQRESDAVLSGESLADERRWGPS